jgi:phenylalanyl-tRNA synthetase beta chain
MNISYNWLKKYIDIPYSPEELVEKLTMCGIEVESVSKTNLVPSGIIVAEVLERNQHPDADKLSVCKVNTGKEILQIVCGAPNCDAGKKVVLATIGTVFEDADKPFKIKKSKLRGVESFGMLCSSSELGFDDDHNGILELPLDAQPGIPLSDIYESDTVYELEITSNRPDWLSYIGVAREIRALSGNELKFPEINLSEVKPDQDYSNVIKIEDYELCPRYSGRIIRNVTVGESPDWLKEALFSIGLRPINNIVDISNYILFELGQPLHIFDLDELKGNKVVIRRAAENETIIALDEKEYKLNSHNLVIADAEKPVCVAGVMGGIDSGVTGKTKNILIECAYFKPSNIRATSRQLSLTSDSSHRFERGVDVNMVRQTSDRAAALILELAGGNLCSGFIDVNKPECFPVPKTVKCYFDRIRTLLGTNISNDKIIDIFEKLDLKVENVTKESCDVLATTSRLDIEREADLAEEVIRIYGLDKVPVVDVYAKPGGGIKEDSYAVLENARDQLITLGLTECVNYTLVDKAATLKGNAFKSEDLLAVANPISAENTIMRPSLLSGLLKNVERNISHNTHEVKIFEFGKVYSVNKKHPEERYSGCIALTGRKNPERYSEEKNRLYDFYDMKGILETWLDQRKLKGYTCRKSDNPIFKAGVRADIIVHGKSAISFGEIAPAYTKGFRLRAPLYIAVIELSNILKIKAKTVEYSAVPQFPASTRDVAVVVDEAMENSEIIACISRAKSKILEKIEVVDIYRDRSLGDGKKSIAYSLTFRNPERTLTDKEVNKAHEFIRNKLEKDLPLTLR